MPTPAELDAQIQELQKTLADQGVSMGLPASGSVPLDQALTAMNARPEKARREPQDWENPDYAPDPRAVRDAARDAKLEAARPKTLEDYKPKLGAEMNKQFMQDHLEQHPEIAGQPPATTPDYITNPGKYTDQSAPDAQVEAQPQQPQYTQPQYVPSHFDERNIPIKAGTRAKMLSTYDNMVGAEQELSRVQQDEAAVTANHMQEEADRAKHSLAGRMQAEDQREEMSRAQLLKLTEMTDAAANGQIDQNQVMAAKGGAGRFSASLGIMLGAGLAANGGPNPALDMLNTEIARSIDVQKANLSLKQQGVHNQQNLLGHYREVFGDERMAEMAFENSARQVAIQKLQADAAKSQSPIIAANAKMAVEKLKQMQLDTQAQFEKMSFVHAQMVGGAPTGAAAISEGLLVKMPDGRVLKAPTQEEGIKMRAKVGAASNIQSNIDKALLIRSKASSAELLNPYSLVRKSLASLEGETKQLVTVYREQGAMSKGDADVAVEALGSMTGILDNNNQVLKATKLRFGEGLKTLADSLGGEHVAQGYRVDPKSGRVVPDAVYTGRSDKPAQRAMPSTFRAAK